MPDNLVRKPARGRGNQSDWAPGNKGGRPHYAEGVHEAQINHNTAVENKKQLKKLLKRLRKANWMYLGFKLTPVYANEYTWASPDFDGGDIDHETATRDPHGSGTVLQCLEQIDEHIQEQLHTLKKGLDHDGT